MLPVTAQPSHQPRPVEPLLGAGARDEAARALTHRVKGAERCQSAAAWTALSRRLLATHALERACACPRTRAGDHPARGSARLRPPPCRRCRAPPPVAPEAPELRALLGEPLNAALNSACVMATISRASVRASFPREHHPRLIRRVVRQLRREPDVPRTHVLEGVAANPFRDSPRHRRANSHPREGSAWVIVAFGAPRAEVGARCSGRPKDVGSLGSTAAGRPMSRNRTMLSAPQNRSTTCTRDRAPVTVCFVTRVPGAPRRAPWRPRRARPVPPRTGGW